MKIQKLSPVDFKKHYCVVPRLCVDLHIKNDDGILLTFRELPTWHHLWHIPGGTVLMGESLERAASRVAKEELGVKIKIIKLLGVIEFMNEVKERGYGQAVTLEYLVEVVSGKFRGSEQAEKIEFFKKIPKNTITEQKAFLLKTYPDLK